VPEPAPDDLAIDSDALAPHEKVTLTQMEY